MIGMYSFRHRISMHFMFNLTILNKKNHVKGMSKPWFCQVTMAQKSLYFIINYNLQLFKSEWHSLLWLTCSATFSENRILPLQIRWKKNVQLEVGEYLNDHSGIQWEFCKLYQSLQKIFLSCSLHLQGICHVSQISDQSGSWCKWRYETLDR